MNEAAFIQLREENDRLAAENAYLRALYCSGADEDFISRAKVKLGVMRQVAELLWAVWDCRPKSYEAIAQSLWGMDADHHEHGSIKVQMCRLRKAIEPAGASIETLWGRGYQLLPADRAKIAAHIGIEVQP